MPPAMRTISGTQWPPTMIGSVHSMHGDTGRWTSAVSGGGDSEQWSQRIPGGTLRTSPAAAEPVASPTSSTEAQMSSSEPRFEREHGDVTRQPANARRTSLYATAQTSQSSCVTMRSGSSPAKKRLVELGRCSSPHDAPNGCGGRCRRVPRHPSGAGIRGDLSGSSRAAEG